MAQLTERRAGQVDSSDEAHRLPEELLPLVRLLERAEGFALAFVRCNVPVEAERLAEAVVLALQERDGHSGRVVRLETKAPDLFAALQALSPPPRPNESLLIVGFERSISATDQLPPALARLNQTRERFRDLPGAVILILPDYALTRLAREAPDFWAWRSGMFEVALEREELLTLAREYTNLDPYRDLAPARKGDHLAVLEGLLAEFGDTSEQERLDLLSQVAALRDSLGDRDGALARAAEAVALARRLGNEALLGRQLLRLGDVLENWGSEEEAVLASQEAVEIYRKLARNPLDAYLRDLAGSLNNLGNSLSALGRREEALFAAQEALDIRRKLARDRGNTFLPDLAASLNNVGKMLNDVGRREEGLEATREAVDNYRELAGQRPGAFMPDVGMSLSNLGSDLSDLGRHEEALAVTLEAADIRRKLARDRPDAFLSDLATTLNNLGPMLNALGRYEEALAVTQEAVDIWRKLARERPDAFLHDLAIGLSNLGNRLHRLGRHEEALTAIQEAVDFQRKLAREHADAFMPTFATSLNNLGEALHALGMHDEAFERAEEAIRALAPHFLRLPAAFASQMADILQGYQQHSEAAGREPDRELVEPLRTALAALDQKTKAGSV